jgi:hypothetical protein
MVERIVIGVFLAVAFAAMVSYAITMVGAHLYGDYRHGIGPVGPVLVIAAGVIGLSWPWFMQWFDQHKRGN